jgi:hypothetical protein
VRAGASEVVSIKLPHDLKYDLLRSEQCGRMTVHSEVILRSARKVAFLGKFPF